MKSFLRGFSWLGLWLWGVSAGAQEKASSSAIMTTVTSVARQVWRTFPDQRSLPAITIVRRGEQPVLARFRPKPVPVLFINESLYDLCRTFEKDSLTALALIVGHELAHYHAHHKEWLEIAQYRRNGATVSALEAKTLVPLEAFADREGVLHAYLAGYDAFRLLKPLYKRMYQTYALPDPMPGYPNRDARIELSLAQLASVRPNALLIDATTFLFVMGENDLAESCLATIAQQWPAVEIQNNLATVYIKKVLSLSSCSEMPFRLPVEWDTYNRLLKLRQQTEETEKKQFLEEARIYAQQAHRGDPDYEPATMNLAIVNVLEGQFGTANDLLASLTRRSKPSPNVGLLSAISQLLQTKDIAKARTDFDRIQGSANEPYNRAALVSWPACVPIIYPAHQGAGDSPERGLGRHHFPLPDRMPITLEINGAQYLDVMGQYDEGTGIDLLRLKYGTSGFYEVLKTSCPDWLTDRGLQVGQLEQEVLTRYGPPESYPLDDGHNRLYAYTRKGLLVSVRAGFVNQLILFHHNR